MEKPAAFSATFADLKLIKTREVVQFIFEVPLEAAAHAQNVVGGWPNPAEERWFAIARLNRGNLHDAHGNQGEQAKVSKP